MGDSLRIVEFNMDKEQVPSKDATDLVCIQLEVHIWSGRRHLDKTDLIHANPEFGKLPEKELANMGSVKICDPAQIKVFQRIKNQAELALARAGLPILGAVGVPAAKYTEIAAKLQELQDEYTKEAAAFVTAYDTAISSWKMKHLLAHPEWEQLFRDLPTAAHVGGRLSFEFHPYRISAPAEEDSPLNQRFHDQIGGLKGELVREVAQEATSFVASLMQSKDNVTTNREFITPKTLGPLKRAAEKLGTFAFIDPSIGPLSEMIHGLLAEVPALGHIEGQHLMMLGAIARLLSDPKGVINLSAVACEGRTAKDVVVDLDLGALGVTPVAPKTPITVEPPSPMGKDAPHALSVALQMPLAADGGGDSAFLSCLI
jgi:hypothetical protein